MGNPSVQHTINNHDNNIGCWWQSRSKCGRYISMQIGAYLSSMGRKMEHNYDLPQDQHWIYKVSILLVILLFQLFVPYPCIYKLEKEYWIWKTVNVKGNVILSRDITIRIWNLASCHWYCKYVPSVFFHPITITYLLQLIPHIYDLISLLHHGMVESSFLRACFLALSCSHLLVLWNTKERRFLISGLYKSRFS